MVEAMRLSPRDTGLRPHEYGGPREAHPRRRQRRRSPGFRRSKEANRNYPSACFNMAAALAHVGRLDEANSAVQTGLCAQLPAYSVSSRPRRLDGEERRPDPSGPG